MWTADSDKLTATHPVTLSYDNGQGLRFKRKISIDDEYLFKIEDSVENTGDKPVQLYSFARVTRVGRPKGSGYAALHEGFIGVIGEEGAQEVNYDKIEKEPHAIKTSKAMAVGSASPINTGALWWLPISPAPLEARYSSIGGKTYTADTVIRANDNRARARPASTQVHVFAGAKEVDTLDAYKNNPGLKRFDLLIDWGWFYFITRPMFRAASTSCSRFWATLVSAVLAVTVLVKLAFLPIANRSYQSIAKMRSIQPKIKELKEKYADDKHKFNMEQMELYKREKISPLGGCIPMLLQIPVFFSLYKVLVVTIEMRQAPFFGWIKDLSAPDPTNLFTLFGLIHWDPIRVAILGPYLALGVWPLLMGVTMWLQMKMNPEPTDEIQKTMFSWMPVMFTFTMGGFASGLVIYWTWNNLLSIIQQWIIMKRAGIKFELWDNLRKTFGRA